MDRVLPHSPLAGEGRGGGASPGESASQKPRSKVDGKAAPHPNPPPRGGRGPEGRTRGGKKSIRPDPRGRRAGLPARGPCIEPGRAGRKEGPDSAPGPTTDPATMPARPAPRPSPRRGPAGPQADPRPEADARRSGSSRRSRAWRCWGSARPGSPASVTAPGGSWIGPRPRADRATRSAARAAWHELNDSAGATARTLRAEARLDFALDRGRDAGLALERATGLEPRRCRGLARAAGSAPPARSAFGGAGDGPDREPVGPPDRPPGDSWRRRRWRSSPTCPTTRPGLASTAGSPPTPTTSTPGRPAWPGSPPDPGRATPDRATRIAELSGLLDRDPGHVPAREALVAALADAGEVDRGRQVLEAWPEAARDARFDRLRARWDLDYDRKPDRAEAGYRRALAAFPHDWRAHYGLARALRSLGRDDEARAEGEAVARLRERLDPAALGPPPARRPGRRRPGTRRRRPRPALRVGRPGPPGRRLAARSPAPARAGRSLIPDRRPCPVGPPLPPIPCPPRESVRRAARHLSPERPDRQGQRRTMGGAIRPSDLRPSPPHPGPPPARGEGVKMGKKSYLAPSHCGGGPGWKKPIWLPPPLRGRVGVGGWPRSRKAPFDHPRRSAAVDRGREPVRAVSCPGVVRAGSGPGRDRKPREIRADDRRPRLAPGLRTVGADAKLLEALPGGPRRIAMSRRSCRGGLRSARPWHISRGGTDPLDPPVPRRALRRPSSPKATCPRPTPPPRSWPGPTTGSTGFLGRVDPAAAGPPPSPTGNVAGQVYTVPLWAALRHVVNHEDISPGAGPPPSSSGSGSSRRRPTLSMWAVGLTPQEALPEV